VIDHLSVNVGNLDRSKAFYEKALAPLGYAAIMSFDDAVGLGVPPKPDFWLVASGALATVHVAFRADSRAMVDAFHRAALAAGGRDNGAPGLRPHYHPNYYGAFVLDLDGHNVEAVCHAPA